MTYNLSWVNSSNDVLSIVSGVNTLTDRWLFVGIIFALYIIFLINMKRYSTSLTVIIASLLCLVISSLFWMADLVSIGSIIIYLVILLVGIIAYQFYG